MTPEYRQVRDDIAANPAVRLVDGLSIRFVAPVIIACLMAASSAAQTAREVRGAAVVEPLQDEPPAKIIIDPPLPEPLLWGRVVIQYRTENLHIVPVFGPAALAVSPRVGHIHVTVDGGPVGLGRRQWRAGGSQRPATRAAHGSAPNWKRQTTKLLDEGAVMFTVPNPPSGASAVARTSKRTTGEDHR